MNDYKYIIDFPELRQTYNYDCGASALQSVLVYYGFTEREDKLLKNLKAKNTDIFDNGVYIKDIVRIAKSYDLEVKVEDGLKPTDLLPYIKQDIPVILLLQAWKDSKAPKDWATDYKNGHYVVAVGYTFNRIIFEDPSSFCRTWLTFKELVERWHAIGDDGKKNPISVAIVIKGKKKFKTNQLIHMD